MLAQLLSVALFTTASAAPWARGQHAVLSFDGSGGYSFNFTAGTTFASTPGSLVNLTASKATDGLTDPALGGYDELNLTVGNSGVLSVRFFAGLDAFVFVRAPAPDPEHAAAFPAVWPSFSIAGHNDSATRCLGWDDHYFFPGGISTSLSGCKSNGPLFLFEAPSYDIPPPPSAAMVLSALSHFTSNQAVNCPPAKKGEHNVSLDSCTLGVSGAVGQCKKCRQYSTSALMLARPSLQRSIRAFGSVVRQKHATKRLRGVGVNQLSAWNDNQAAYSWWTVGPDQEVWGKPEDLYVKLKQGYDAAEIPVKSWEPDNNWIVTYKDGNQYGNGTGVAKNWIGRQVRKTVLFVRFYIEMIPRQARDKRRKTQKKNRVFLNIVGLQRRALPLGRRGMRSSFEPFMYIKVILNQDRLGTNIGRTHKRPPFSEVCLQDGEHLDGLLHERLQPK